MSCSIPSGSHASLVPHRQGAARMVSKCCPDRRARSERCVRHTPAIVTFQEAC